MKKKLTKKPIKKAKGKYFEAVGKRKTAVAKVRIFKTKPGFFINEKKLQEYFPTLELQKIVRSPLKLSSKLDKIFVSIKIKGGGKKAQAEACCLGIARALLKLDEKLRPIIKTAGFLTRDARKKERKKPGLKKARKAPQWSKR